MKSHIALSLLAIALIFSAGNVQGQNKGNNAKGKNNKPAAKEIPTVALPANSNDCLFAIELQPDVPFGPTSAPQGAGRIQEIMRDKSNPNVFEFEHNSTWYKFTAPYSGNLEINITPNNEWDDYDFVVYKYTDVYFSNHLIQNKIKPLAASLTTKDTTGIAAATPKNSKGQVAAKPRSRRMTTATMGMRADGKRLFLAPGDNEEFLRSLPVRKGETYYIVLDNKSAKGEGHTIKASIQVESFEPLVVFYDPTLKKNVDVDLLILEKKHRQPPHRQKPLLPRRQNQVRARIQLLPLRQEKRLLLNLQRVQFQHLQGRHTDALQPQPHRERHHLRHRRHLF